MLPLGSAAARLTKPYRCAIKMRLIRSMSQGVADCWDLLPYEDRNRACSQLDDFRDNVGLVGGRHSGCLSLVALTQIFPVGKMIRTRNDLASSARIVQRTQCNRATRMLSLKDERIQRSCRSNLEPDLAAFNHHIFEKSVYPWPPTKVCHHGCPSLLCARVR